MRQNARKFAPFFFLVGKYQFLRGFENGELTKLSNEIFNLIYISSNLNIDVYNTLIIITVMNQTNNTLLVL